MPLLLVMGWAHPASELLGASGYRDKLRDGTSKLLKSYQSSSVMTQGRAFRAKQSALFDRRLVATL